MNTGRDNREVRERDRQGESNGERLFPTTFFRFSLDENDFLAKKVDYRDFFGIFGIYVLLVF